MKTPNLSHCTAHPSKVVDVFRRSLVEVFGVADFSALIGRPCVLYRSQYTQMAEAIDGGCGIFSIDEFRRRMWPTAEGELLPRDRHVADLRMRREIMLRNAAALQAEIDKLTQ